MKQFFTLIPRALALLCLLLLSLTVRAQTSYDAVVAQDGSGAYKTVQAAIDAAPTGRTTPYTIYIKNGRYKEKINVPANKPFLHFIGQSVANVVLTYDDYSGKPNPAGGTFGTTTSASVTIRAADCLAMNITFENTTGDSPQALALNVIGDRVAFRNCRFLGGQDTLYTNTNGARNYFVDCYIDGTVDFIFGGARALFEHCVVYPKTRRDGTGGSFITAANTPSNQPYGYVFRDCYIPANRGTTTYTLGRPWNNDSGSSDANRAHNKVVWLNTIIGPNSIRPEGWSVWDAGTVTSVITYAEYKSRAIEGNLVDVSKRVPWSKQLTDAEAATYTREAMFGTWDPCALAPNFCADQAPDIAVSNFMIARGTTTTPSALMWNISWPIAGVQYEVFRSAARKGTYTSVHTTTAPNAFDINFTATDAIPAPGSSHFYYVRASKAGLATHITDTLQVSSTPTIGTTGTLQGFLQGGGQPSASQSFLLTGENLTSNLVVTPPANFQVSTNGTDWFTAAAPLTLPPNSTNAVPSTSVRVRLNAAATGTYNGSISLTSTGAAPVSLAVSGTRQAAALPQSVVLQRWPMTRNNQDSTAARLARVQPSTPTFRKFVVSNGSAAAAIPPYSAQYGQAFAPLAAGSWLTSAGGNGGNLNRTYYEQFTVAGTAGTAVRVDSVLFDAFVTSSVSNTKLAVVWSKTGFVSDSADVTGGTGPAGGLVSTANGGFTTPILTTSASSNYRLALAGNAGVMLQPGQQLTFRMYFSCGSSSASGRFATLRNVVVKGEASSVTSTRAASSLQLGAYPNPTTQLLTLQHPAAQAGAAVTVYSFTGQRITHVACKTGVLQTQLNMSNLTPGSYLVVFTNGPQRLTTLAVKQ